MRLRDPTGSAAIGRRGLLQHADVSRPGFLLQSRRRWLGRRRGRHLVPRSCRRIGERNHALHEIQQGAMVSHSCRGAIAHRIRAWIDDERIVDVDTTGRKLATRIEVRLSQPLGITSWETRAALRNIQYRVLAPEQEPANAAPAEPAKTPPQRQERGLTGTLCTSDSCSWRCARPSRLWRRTRFPSGP